MSNFIVTLAVFLITVIGALFAIPYFVDWNGYRGVFEEEATRLLGREVRVGGAVNLHLLPTPYFRFEKVRIADTSVNLQEPFFRSENLAIKLSIPPLFRGVVEANEIELQRPVVRFALNAKDGWNWQSFGDLLTGAAYLPSNVALASVKLTDGVLVLHGPDGAERTRFEAINGELAAPALDGPYRFRGKFGKGRAERELRVGTARPEGDGSVRFKATLRSADSGTTYALDGRVADFMGKPHLSGDLTAQLPIAGLWNAPTQGKQRPQGEGEPAFDLKAALNADPAGATLTNLALAFEQSGRPQLITGDLKAQWRGPVTVEMSLASRWLDLDRMAGASETAGPLDSIVPLAIAVRDMLPAEGRSRATFAIDQGNVGRDAVSNLRFSLTRTEDKLQIDDLRFGMPGGSRGELQGVVTGMPDAPRFEGGLSLRGTSLVRFLGWATANALALDSKADGTFGIRSQVTMAAGGVVAHNFMGDISGTAVRGEAHYRWEGRPELSVLIDSPQLDARAFIPAGSSLTDILDVILRGPAARPSGEPTGPGVARPSWRGAQTDARIRLNAGQLFTASRAYRDVAMELELRGGRLKLPQLRVSGDEGFSLELEGDVDNAATRPKGILRGVIGAASAQGVAALADLLDVPAALRPDGARAQAMVPLRLAGSMSLGTRTQTSADLTLDGELSGASTKLTARLDGSDGGWRKGAADVTALVDAPDARVIASLLTPGGPPATANPIPGQLLLKARGVPDNGLASLASVDAGDLALSFRGQLVPAQAGTSASGDLEIRAADGARLAGLAGLTPPLRFDGVPIAGSLKVSLGGNKIALESRGLRVGNAQLAGQLALAEIDGGRRRVEATLETGELDLAKLLGPLLDRRLAAIGAAEAAISGQQSPWPDDAFDGSVLDRFEGSVRLRTRRLLLAEGIGLSQAGIDIALDRGKVDVTRLEGGCLGGRCTATVRLDKAAAGMDLSGSLRIADATLQAVAADSSKPRAIGTIGGEIKFAGKGTSPRNVLSVLQGGGTLQLGNARLGVVWPGAIAAATEAALKAEPDKLSSVVKDSLAQGLGGGELPLPSSVKVEITDGRLNVLPFTVETPDGKAQGAASLDVRNLNFDSEWRLDQKPPGPGEKPALPAVVVTYRGPVAALGKLDPRVASDGLERELAVRRMERDVEELERLRKLDEARRRDEAERQRRQFELTPVPVPVAPAPAQPRPAAPG